MSKDTNDITGDKLVTKPTTDLYRKEWERIFGSKKKILCNGDDIFPVAFPLKEVEETEDDIGC